MLASITPLGQRGRGASWRRTVTAYAVASTLTAAAVGALLGGIGDVAWHRPPDEALMVVGGLAIGASLLDIAGRRLGPHRQVDEGWLTSYRDWVVGLGYGAQLGLGVATIVTSASIYVVALLELLTAGPVAGAVVGATFGLLRALPVLSTGRVVDAESLRAHHRRWQRAAMPWTWLTTAGVATAGTVLIATGAA
jgi:hypothetical protein